MQDVEAMGWQWPPIWQDGVYVRDAGTIEEKYRQKDFSEGGIPNGSWMSRENTVKAVVVPMRLRNIIFKCDVTLGRA